MFQYHWLHQNVQQILNVQVQKYVPTNIVKTHVKYQNHVTLLLNVLQLTIGQFVIVQMDGQEILKFSVINVIYIILKWLIFVISDHHLYANSFFCMFQLVARPIAIVFMIKHASTAIVWTHVLLRVVVMELIVLYNLTKLIVFVRQVHKVRQWYLVYQWCANIMKTVPTMKHATD